MNAPQHAARPMATRQMVMGVILCGLGALIAVVSVAFGVLLVGVGGALTALGVWMRRSAAAAELVNPALDASIRGDFATARELLDRAEPTHRASHIQRAIASQRAFIGWRCGDLDEVERRTSGALALPISWLTEAAERMVDLELRSQRSLARAAAGRTTEAREDVVAVSAARGRSASALARITLAEALLLERSGDRAALREHLATNRALLLNASPPHEREMVRALTRLSRSKVSSAYREVAPPAPSPGQAPPIDAWLAAVVPAAAPFASRPRAMAPPTPGPSAETAVREGDDTRYQLRKVVRAGSPSGRTTLLLWVILIMVFIGVWTVLPSDGPVAPTVASTPSSSSPFGWLGLAVAAAGFAAMALWLRRLRRTGEAEAVTSQEAAVELARGDVDGRASALFAQLAGGSSKLAAAHGELGLARIAHLDARFEDVLAHCDRGIERVTGNEGAYVGAVDLLLPDLASARAGALAALGRFDEAQREVATLVARFPTYPMVSQARLTVDLVEAGRRGDAARAGEAAARISPSMTLALEHAMLASLARAITGAMGAEEREDLMEDLRQDRRCAAWLAAVAPSLLAELGGARFSAPAASRDAPSSRWGCRGTT